jgi:hypothetical protein
MTDVAIHALSLPEGGVVPEHRTRATEIGNDPRWKGLYRVAGIGALLTGILIPLQIIAFIAWPPPIDGTVADWFDLFTRSPFIGLVSFDLAILLEEMLLIPIVLALYVLLRRENESLMAIAAGFWAVSIALFIASNTGFEMLALSQGFAQATAEAERLAYLAAGQGMVASYMEQGSAFVVGYLLASLAGVVVGVSMLRTRVFSRWAAYAVIGGNVLGLGLFVPAIGVPLSIGSVVVLIIWYLLIGWRLLWLSAGTRRTTSEIGGKNR